MLHRGDASAACDSRSDSGSGSGSAMTVRTLPRYILGRPQRRRRRSPPKAPPSTRRVKMTEAELLAAVEDIRARLDAQYAASVGSESVAEAVEETASLRHTARFHN